MTRVERVARALADEDNHIWAAMAPRLQSRFMQYAEAAIRAAGSVDDDELVTALAEMLYDDQTGTSGKFATSTYRSSWIRRVGDVAAKWRAKVDR